MLKFYVYIHMRPDGTPFYVGKGTHIRAFTFRRRNRHHASIVAKHGAQNILVDLMECPSEAEALQAEIECIALLRGAGVELCNVTDGGEGVVGLRHSDETKYLLSLLAQAQPRQPRSEETKAKIGAANKINLTGHKQSAETIARRSATLRALQLSGRKHSDETRAKMREAWKKRRSSC